MVSLYRSLYTNYTGENCKSILKSQGTCRSLCAQRLETEQKSINEEILPQLEMSTQRCITVVIEY